MTGGASGSTGGPARWTVAVAIKPLSSAKSRLADVLTQKQRSELVCAMAVDVIRAARAAGSVQRCLVVTADRRAGSLAHSLGADVLTEPQANGLNAAFALAVAHVGPAPLALLVADLPCLTGQALDRVLAAVPAAGVGVVADAAGEGTTMLAARAAHHLRPMFGPASRARHIDGGAVDISEWCDTDLRRDVDTPEMLLDVSASGAAGFFTSGWFARSPVELSPVLARQAG